jgi:hypothetical protein
VAENEILCVADGRRWKDTRDALREGMPVNIVAERAAEELTRGLPNSLVQAFRKGQTLADLLLAAEMGESELRACARKFHDRQLARIVANAIRVSDPADRMALARRASEMIVDDVHETILKYAAVCDAYLMPGVHGALADALAARFAACRVDLRDVVWRSMRGERVSGRRSPRGTRASSKVRAAEVAQRSLLPGSVSGDHRAPRRR